MNPNDYTLVSQPLAASASAHPWDVLKAKAVLQQLGHYAAPDWGLSEFPDAALYDALRDFQLAQALRVDGVMKPGGETEAALLSTLDLGQAAAAIREAAAAIQAMGRNGDELLAHISLEEAQLLDAVTDGASVNPATGLLEFYFDASRDHKEQQARVESAFGRDRDGREHGYDASLEHKKAQTAADSVFARDRDGEGRDHDRSGASARQDRGLLETNAMPRTVIQEEPDPQGGVQRGRRVQAQEEGYDPL